MATADPKTSGANRRFWGYSLALHLLILGMMLWLVPAREYRKDKPSTPPVIKRGEALDAVIEQVRWRTVEQLTVRVNLLKAGQQRMGRHQEIFQAYFDPFAMRQQADAFHHFDENRRVVEEGMVMLDRMMSLTAEEHFKEFVEEGVPLLPRVSAALEGMRRSMILMEWKDSVLLEDLVQFEDALWRLGPVLRRVAEDHRALTAIRDELQARQEAFPGIQLDWDEAVEEGKRQLAVRSDAIARRNEARLAARTAEDEGEREAQLKQAARYEQIRLDTVEDHRVVHRKANQLKNQRSWTERRIADLEERLTARSAQREENVQTARNAYTSVTALHQNRWQRLDEALRELQKARAGATEGE